MSVRKVQKGSKKNPKFKKTETPNDGVRKLKQIKGVTER